jgi:hypothetical protein
LNRAEFTKVVVAMIFSESEIQSCTQKLSGNVFPDVPRESWFAPFVCLAHDKAIISGHDDGLFRPEAPIDAAAAAKIIVNAFELAKENELEKETEKWYLPFAKQMFKQDLMPATFENPAHKVTRAEMADMIYRLKGSQNETNVASYALAREKKNEIRNDYEISISYPIFQGFANEFVEEKINSIIKEKVDYNIESFKKDLAIAEDFDVNVPKSTMYGDYEITYSDENFISLFLRFSVYFSGAAHPNTYTDSMIYDLNENRVIGLEDLLESDSDALNKISAYNREVLKQQITWLHGEGMLLEDFLLPSTEPKSENFSAVSLYKKGVIFYFDPYVVAPYVAGSFRVYMPFYELKENLKTNFTNAEN